MSSTTTLPSSARAENALSATNTAVARFQNISFQSFLTTLSVGAGLFVAQFLAFYLLRNRLRRIYAPKTYLVPERERTNPPPEGFLRWIVPIFKTPDREFISKCGLDGYLFVRYLRMLLKIFVPSGLLILPILLPLNHIGTSVSGISGMDAYGWANINPVHTDRLWAHLVLAIVFVIWICYVAYDELRRYIRLRQHYLTSPEHRLRASATTVLITNIPRKWLTLEALDALYDVFPGGIRNIWINRNFDKLQEMVDERDKIAIMLENAETALIRKCRKKHLKQLAKEEKETGRKRSKAERKQEQAEKNQRAEEMAINNPGISSGNPHQAHTLEEELGDASSRNRPPGKEQLRAAIPMIGQSLEAVSRGLERGIGTIGHGVNRLVRKVREDVDQARESVGSGTGYIPELSKPQPSTRNPSIEDDTGENREKVLESKGDNTPGSSASAQGGSRPASQQHLDGTVAARFADDDIIVIDPSPFASQRSNQNSGIGKEKEENHLDSHSDSFNPRWKFWRQKSDFPSPQPHTTDSEEFPLSAQTATQTHDATARGSESAEQRGEIEVLSNLNMLKDRPGETVWQNYLKQGDRETMRLPVFSWSWWPSLPLIGRKVDTIYYCRKRLAELNSQIEADQNDPTKFPLMNSAFIQFNHQVAAHMAVQCLNHHIPKNMAPRVVEVNPDDVQWENLSMKWKERYLRTLGIFMITVGLIIAYIFPAVFVGSLSQISELQARPWLAWLTRLPTVVLSIVQGVLPPTLIALFLVLIPLIMRLLSGLTGQLTGVQRELWIQRYYFAFVFFIHFFIVSVSAGISTLINELSDNPGKTPNILAENLPKAANYFFNFMILQALSNSATTLAQLFSLFMWFVWGRMLDSSAREKFVREIGLPEITWGSFFPVYTLYAVIGIIYSVICPLVMVFNIITFSLFWVVYRYQTLYVTRFRFDTGGLLFPTAVNQLFTGVYFMEICLVGLYFISRNVHGQEPAQYPEGIIMIVVFVLTIFYQILLNRAFHPAYKYIPITMEDEAVLRDEEFARMQNERWNRNAGEEQKGSEPDLQEMLEGREHQEKEEEQAAEDIELEEIKKREAAEVSQDHLKTPDGATSRRTLSGISLAQRSRKAWAERSRNRRNSGLNSADIRPFASRALSDRSILQIPHQYRRATFKTAPIDVEAQSRKGELIFSGFHDDIEDLTPEERDKLVQRAFQHSALRAKRPVVWIPRDELGISDDEILRTKAFSDLIWISNESAWLDARNRVRFSRPPPDFSEVDLVRL